jgi:hypothetical protein
MKTYDDWKTTNPADEELGEWNPMPAECDCCGELAVLTRSLAFGCLETWACDGCRGVEE